MCEVVAVIPARGGSRSLPGKNLRPLGGHPLIAWSIETALQNASVGRVLVSTDDEEIRAVALRYGAEAPFLRPPELARDDTPDFPVFEHVLGWLRAGGHRPEILVQLRPTSPLRDPRWIDQGVCLLEGDPSADCVRSVVPASQSPYKMWRPAGDRLMPLLGSIGKELFNQPRQSLPAVLWQTGHLDVIRASALDRHRSLTGRRILPLPVDPEYAVDIDTADHLRYAEWLLGRGHLKVPVPNRSR